MILLDSSVVIDLFRAQDDRILDLILEHDAAICGITHAVAVPQGPPNQLLRFPNQSAQFLGFRIGARPSLLH